MKINHFLNLLLCVLLGLFLSACAKKAENMAESDIVADAATQATDAKEAANADISAHEQLGTKWGDDLTSHATKVDIKRLTDEPIAQATLRYANKKFQGKAVNSLSLAAGKISFTVVDDRGHALPMVREGKHYYVKATEGQSYQLSYKNHSAQTYEIVASVDGLDVLNGQQASQYSSGYVLHPHQTLTIEGFRKSESNVASFTFSKPDDSYAANTPSGSIDNTGILGTVVYELYNPEKAVAADVDEYAPAPNAFPADKKN